MAELAEALDAARPDFVAEQIEARGVRDCERPWNTKWEARAAADTFVGAAITAGLLLLALPAMLADYHQDARDR